MSYRFMRVIVFFDLPTITSEDKSNYRHFRKALLENGFIMLQESVYSKLLLTQSAQQAAVDAIRRVKPPAGLVQVLTITEKQYSRMEYLVGEPQKETIDTDERVVIL